MKKIDFSGDILDVSGAKLGDMSETLAVTLQQSNKGNPVKVWGWAMKIYKDKFITVDDADLDFLKNFIEESANLFNVSKAQILERISNATEVKE